MADLSRELVSANYSALGILGADGSLVQFISSGISQADRDRIGAPPVGKGVLGVVLLEGQSLGCTTWDDTRKQSVSRPTILAN